MVFPIQLLINMHKHFCEVNLPSLKADLPLTYFTDLTNLQYTLKENSHAV